MILTRTRSSSWILRGLPFQRMALVVLCCLPLLQVVLASRQNSASIHSIVQSLDASTAAGATVRRSATLNGRARSLLEEFGHVVPDAARSKVLDVLSSHESLVRRVSHLADRRRRRLSGDSSDDDDDDIELDVTMRALQSAESSVTGAMSRHRVYDHLRALRSVLPKRRRQHRHLETKDSSNLQNLSSDPRASLRATASSLQSATGIDVASKAGRLFQIVSTLFDNEPPAEALGVSAKFYSNGKRAAAVGRYHVGLQPPCECWGLDKGKVLNAAREAAEVLHAPRLVRDWIGTLETHVRTEPPSSAIILPSLGFGISLDPDAHEKQEDGASETDSGDSIDNAIGKFYVLNYMGDEMPMFPLTTGRRNSPRVNVDDVLPKLVQHPTSNEKGHRRHPVRMLSLEWRVGEPTHVQVRQYAMEDVNDGTGSVRTHTERLDSYAPPALAEVLNRLVTEFGGATEDIAVTEPFDPDQVGVGLHGKVLPRLVSPSRSKVGLKFVPASTFDMTQIAINDAELLKSLQPGLEEIGVPFASVEQWLASSLSIGHPVSNIQIGNGFVTLYRHPSTFGHVDMKSTVQRRALHAAASRRHKRVLDSEDSLLQTECEAARAEFGNVWSGLFLALGEEDPPGDPKCNDAMQLPESSYTCPSVCVPTFQRLVDSCDECAEIWEACDEPIPDSVFHPETEWAVESVASIQNVTSSVDGTSHFPYRCVDAMRDEFTTVLKLLHDDSYTDITIDATLNEYNVEPTDTGAIVTYRVLGALGSVGASNSSHFLQLIVDELGTAFRDDLLHNHYSQTDTAEWSKCTLDTDATVNALESASVSPTSSWTDLPIDLVPEDKRWLRPYGGASLLQDMMWANAGCKYPFFPYWQLLPEDEKVRFLRQQIRNRPPGDRLVRGPRTVRP